jgi:hypothetical protein
MPPVDKTIGGLFSMYTAYYMPDDDLNRTKHGFETEADAEAYIKTQLCKYCKIDLETGYSFFNSGEKYPVQNIWDTGCGCEWFIELTKDFEK